MASNPQLVAGFLRLIGPVSSLAVDKQDKKLAKHKRAPSVKRTDSKEDVSGCFIVVLCTVSRCLCSCLLALAKSTKLIGAWTSEFGGIGVESWFRSRASSLGGGYSRRRGGGARVASG